MSMYFDYEGQPIDLMEWARLMEDHHTRQIAHTEVGETRISTVWLGLDHSFFGGPPQIFETMIFGGPCDQDQWRYSTKELALAGHQLAVDLVRSQQPDDQEVQQT